jgi:calcineurin-like phosphoesterase family protein
MRELWTADTHAGHKNILKYCKRPFANVREMDEILIANWNKIVNPDDLVWHLGDVAFCCTLEYAINFVKRLNGRKRLILGNHDDLALEMYTLFPGLFESVDKMEEIKVNGQKIVMCHYALATWHHAYKGTWSLYGHTHNTFQNEGKSLDIGVDAWDFKPVTFEQLKWKMDQRPIHELIHNKWDKSNNELTQ